MNGSDVLTRSAAVSATAVESETFLVDADGNQIYHLDAMASAVWRLLEAPQRIDDVYETFCQAFPDVERARIRIDIESCLGELLRLGFVVRVT